MEYDDLIGVPFKDGGRDTGGLDCWGLVRECYKRRGMAVKDYAVSAMQMARIETTMKHEEYEWEKLPSPKEGCLVVIRLPGTPWANHAGVYIGDGKFIHAYAPSGVVVDRIKRWQSRIVGFYEPR